MCRGITKVPCGLFSHPPPLPPFLTLRLTLRLLLVSFPPMNGGVISSIGLRGNSIPFFFSCKTRMRHVVFSISTAETTTAIAAAGRARGQTADKRRTRAENGEGGGYSRDAHENECSEHARAKNWSCHLHERYGAT